MKYVLFVGSRVGYEALRLMIGLRTEISHVFIESEHPHEHEKHFAESMELCRDHQIPCSLDMPMKDVPDILHALEIDYMISFGFRKMIPERITSVARIAALGTHFAPLPRYRGFAPLNWVLINGETETAVNLFVLRSDVDSGAIVDREPVPIYYSDDINSLLERCLCALRTLMSRTVPLLESRTFTLETQDESKATYCCARNPGDGRIDWLWPSRKVYNLVRALTYPYPGAYTSLNGNKLVVWSCEQVEVPTYEGRIPGKVIKHIDDVGVIVLCAAGAILLKDVQIDGAARQTADRVIRGVRVTLGSE